MNNLPINEVNIRKDSHNSISSDEKVIEEELDHLLTTKRQSAKKALLEVILEMYPNGVSFAQLPQ
jgi:methyltransferase-like protein